MNGNDVARLRGRLGWTQERMARELGLSWSTVNRWERGKTVPRGLSILALERLDRATDADPASVAAS